MHRAAVRTKAPPVGNLRGLHVANILHVRSAPALARRSNRFTAIYYNQLVLTIGRRDLFRIVALTLASFLPLGQRRQPKPKPPGGFFNPGIAINEQYKKGAMSKELGFTWYVKDEGTDYVESYVSAAKRELYDLCKLFPELEPLAIKILQSGLERISPRVWKEHQAEVRRILENRQA